MRLKLRPTSAVGVLFALVHEDRVPLSIALADYNPDTDEWRDVSEDHTHTENPTAPCCNFHFLFQFILVMSGDAILASSPAPLCDGQSHEIEVTISANRTLLLVDGQPGRGQDAEVQFDLLSQSSTFVGGLPGESTNPVNSLM